MTSINPLNEIKFKAIRQPKLVGRNDLIGQLTPCLSRGGPINLPPVRTDSVERGHPRVCLRVFHIILQALGPFPLIFKHFSVRLLKVL